MASSRVSGGVLETGYTVKFITSELPVIRPESMASADITSYERTYQDLAAVSGHSNGRFAHQDRRMSWNHAGFLR
jgi:hypothetical protein